MGRIHGISIFLALLFCAFQAKMQSCLHDKGLVKLELTVPDILKNHEQTCDEDKKNFANVLLGYVTPWNPQGKDAAVKFAKKFNIISPVWYNLIVSDGQYKVRKLFFFQK